MYKVDGTQNVEVELHGFQVSDLCRVRIKELMEWDQESYYFVDDSGHLIQREEYSAGVHSGFDNKKVRVATELDCAVCKVLDFIDKKSNE